MKFHPLLTDFSQVSEATRRFVEQTNQLATGDARFETLVDAVARRIALQIDNSDAIGKLAEINAMLDSIGSKK